MIAGRRLDLALAVLVASVLGVGISYLLGHPSRVLIWDGPELRAKSPAADSSMGIRQLVSGASAQTTTATLERGKANVLPIAPLEAAGEQGEDLEDVLLLYDSRNPSNFDTNFCVIAEYYGLRCKRIAVDVTHLSDDRLKDSQGHYFKIVALSAEALSWRPSPLRTLELEMLREAIEEAGTSLLISDVDDEVGATELTALTGGSGLSVTKPVDTRRDWIVSSEAPEITRELTGRTIVSTSADPQSDFALGFDQRAPVATLLRSQDDGGAEYAIFARYTVGAGSVFVDACGHEANFLGTPLKDLYYEVYNFSQIMPIMFTLRYVMGDEVWHSAKDYANLTIDDPALTEPWHQLSYTALLAEMGSHNFHTTIAMHPVTWVDAEPEVVSLFLGHPDRFSLVEHGNNGDGYEFFKYPPPDHEFFDGQVLPRRPLAEQEADIVQGLARLESLRIMTGITAGRVMVFPQGISPVPTLRLLKKYNFLATVNAQDVPLDASRPADWDYGMYQANMNYANFPTLTRRHPGTYEPFEADLQPFFLDLFIDKPALFYSHAGQLFASGMDTFDIVADEINGLQGEVEWRSLGDIITHLYLERVEDDGSMGVMVYGNHVVITNEAAEEMVYHITKEETLNVPISRVTVNGHEFPYRVEKGELMLDVRVPPGSSVELVIHYGD